MQTTWIEILSHGATSSFDDKCLLRCCGMFRSNRNHRSELMIIHGFHGRLDVYFWTHSIALNQSFQSYLCGQCVFFLLFFFHKIGMMFRKKNMSKIWTDNNWFSIAKKVHSFQIMQIFTYDSSWYINIEPVFIFIISRVKCVHVFKVVPFCA